MRSIRQKLCSFLRWMNPPMCQRSRLHAEVFWTKTQRLWCAVHRGWSSNAKAIQHRVWSPALYCPMNLNLNLEKRCKMHPNPFFSITPIAPNSVSWVGQPVPPKEIFMLKAGGTSGSMTHLLVFTTNQVWPQRLPSQIPNMKAKWSFPLSNAHFGSCRRQTCLVQVRDHDKFNTLHNRHHENRTLWARR